jgi:drug/metabolite transporter (DMT)-like permease
LTRVLDLRTVAATGAALACFAANSLLCRAALAGGAIDAWSFTAVRIAAGAGALVLLASLGGKRNGGRGSFLSALALYGYAGTFSLAYLSLGAGVGALVLFASVQATMLGWSAWRGTRPSARELRGFALAFAGLVVLTLPGASLPDPLGLVLMTLAGIAWGAYTLRGRAGGAPLFVTRDNFLRALPLALGALAAALFFGSLHVSARGLALAAASGAAASGVGYSLWYLALPRLSAVQAALLQLLVPVLAAALGILMLGEPLSWRLAVAGPLVLIGVGWAVLARRKG